jgi:uncharacterized protein
MQIGSARAERGEKASGYVQVAKTASGYDVSFPVTIINGKGEGPVFVADAAMHGTEVIGTATISRFYRKTDPQKMHGTFIGVPIVNMWAFEAWHRLPTLFDSFDLEQLFPGDASGSITERLAFTFFEQIARKADYLLDFHGQDQYWQPTFAALVPVPSKSGINTEIYEQCLRLATVFGVDQIWRVNKPRALPETLMKQKSTPAISLEFGGTGDFNRIEEYIELATTGLENVLSYVGITDSGNEKNSKKNRDVSILDLEVVSNNNGGMWRTNSRVRDRVKEGQLLGTILDSVTAEPIEEISAPFDGELGLVWSPPVIKPAVAVIGIGRPQA